MLGIDVYQGQGVKAKISGLGLDAQVKGPGFAILGAGVGRALRFRYWLTHCFSALAELLVDLDSWPYLRLRLISVDCRETTFGRAARAEVLLGANYKKILR